LGVYKLVGILEISPARYHQITCLLNNTMQTTPAAQRGYDVIVIGAGAMGSATAYHLAQDRRRVLLLEQFTVGHTRGSSHGGSRIVRYTHDTLDKVRIMPATLALWQRLEAESGAHLLQMTGGLYIAPPDEAFLQGAQAALIALDHPYRLLSSGEIRQEFPQFRLPADYVALYQEHSGILAASRCVQTIVAQAVKHGAEVREETRVLGVTPTAAGVTVQIAGTTRAATVYAQQAIITAGPWAKRLLDPLITYDLPLQPTHQQVAYFLVERPEIYAVGHCPLYIFTADPHFYGFPIFELPGHVKIALELLNHPVDPDAPRHADSTALRELSDAVRQTLVGVNPTPAHVELCLYTETPNRDFIIDRHPEHPQILFGVGFSGRGFKFAVAVGRLLADLAQQPPGSYASEFWLPRYAVNRFAPASSSTHQP
jgi:monomeric sarcosine oxidase